MSNPEVENHMRNPFTYKPARDERNSQTKIPREEIPRLFELREKGYTQAAIGKIFGVSQQLIGYILRGKSRISRGEIPHKSFKVGCVEWQRKNFKEKRCNRCPSSKRLQLHHKDRNRKNWKKNNLETLCIPCHRKEHRRAA